MEEKQEMTCNRCNIGMELMTANFSYLGHAFRADVPRCPNCGQIYIPEELVKGRMAEVEMDLEDK